METIRDFYPGGRGCNARTIQHADPHTHTNPDCNSNADAKTNFHAEPDPDADAYSHSDMDANAIANVWPFANTHDHANTDSQAPNAYPPSERDECADANTVESAADKYAGTYSNMGGESLTFMRQTGAF